MASEFVRVSRPSRGETSASGPSSLRVCSRRWVPSAAGREDHVACRERPPLPARDSPGADRGDGPAVADASDARDGAALHDSRARPFGQAEIVLGQGVLRVVPTTGHAGTAVDAGVARGSGAAEVRVGHRRAGGGVGPTEVDCDRSGTKGVVAAEFACGVLQQQVGFGEHRVGCDAEHATGLCEEGGQLTAPVGEGRPVRALVESGRGFVERVGIAEGSAADTGAAQHEDVAEQGRTEDARASEAGREQVVPHVPGRPREVGVGEAPRLPGRRPGSSSR